MTTCTVESGAPTDNMCRFGIKYLYNLHKNICIAEEHKINIQFKMIYT